MNPGPSFPKQAQRPKILAGAIGWAVGLALGSPGLAQPVSQPVPLEAPPAAIPSSQPSGQPSSQPSAQPSGLSAVATPLITPSLPSLREFDRYMPQDTAINLVLNLEHRKVYVFAGQKLLASFPVAIGRPDFPTPTGEFEVFEMIVNPSWKSPWTGEVEAPGPDGSLGLRWIGFHEMSNGVIGFHGTPNVASIGRAASHGCVRMRNEDIVQLYDLVKVGTPVRVEP